MGTPDRHEELKDLAPTLHGLPKNDPFVVGSAFFDRFPHAVQARAVRPRKMLRTRRPAWALATLALLLGGLALWWDRTPAAPTAPELVEVPVLSDAELAAWQEETGDLTVEDLSTLQWDTVPVTLTQDELLAYIEHEDLDLHEIITYLE